MDGATTSPDSAEPNSPPNESVVVAPKTPLPPSTQEQAEALNRLMVTAKMDQLKKLGIKPNAAKRILSQALPGAELLTRQVVAHVNMVSYANTTEEIVRAIEYAGRLVRDPKVDAKVRAQLATAIAQLSQGLARIGEANLATAEKMDEEFGKANPPRNPSIVADKVFIGGFPPVANAPQRAPLALARTGDDEDAT